MISVGFSRNDSGSPVMREKAYPTSEQIFTEMGPSLAEEARLAGRIVFFDCAGDGENKPRRRYSHSSGDL